MGDLQLLEERIDNPSQRFVQCLHQTVRPRQVHFVLVQSAHDSIKYFPVIATDKALQKQDLQVFPHLLSEFPNFLLFLQLVLRIGLVQFLVCDRLKQHLVVICNLGLLSLDQLLNLIILIVREFRKVGPKLVQTYQLVLEKDCSKLAEVLGVLHILALCSHFPVALELKSQNLSNLVALVRFQQKQVCRG